MFRIVLVAAALLVSVGYAATYRGVVPVVKGKCNVTMFIGREMLLGDGTHNLNEPCESVSCDSVKGEVDGMGCAAISCPDGCEAEAQDPAGVYPACCQSKCNCPEDKMPESISMTG